MSRTDTEYLRIDWDRFCRIVIEKWQGKMLDKDIFNTGTLYRSIDYGYRTVNAMNQSVGRGSVVQAVRIPDKLYFTFPLYGIYVERGVGRGYTRGNGGELVKFMGAGRGRERRTWYYRIFSNERKRLGELVAEHYGRAASAAIRTIEVRRITAGK